MKPYVLIFLGLTFLSARSMAVETASDKHKEDVRHRVEQVVPYRLERTLETFTQTVHGGVQHVVTKSADDSEQIKLIQAHLLKTVERYRKGDFSTTERIHGADMPGLMQLKRAETDDIKFEYKALPNGAQIHYSTEYPQYVQALHEWLDAQASDHGNDAIPGHIQHHSTVAE